MDYLYALQCIREASPEYINYFFVFISEVLLKVVLAYIAVIYWCCDKREGASMLLGYAGAFQINQFIKNIACVYRPWIVDSRLHVAAAAESTATGYSFPSGHTVTAGASYGGIGLWQKKRKWILVSMILLIIITAFSRNWLGAHTMQDIIVAVIEAGVVLIIANVLKLYVANNPKKDTLIAVLGIVGAIVVLIFMCLKSYPKDYDVQGNLICDPWLMLKDCYTAAGMMIGAFSGWWLERRFVKFTADATQKTLIIRGIFGVVSFLIIYLLAGVITKAIIPEHFDHLVKYFILFFYTMFIYPLIFTAVERRKK